MHTAKNKNRMKSLRMGGYFPFKDFSVPSANTKILHAMSAVHWDRHRASNTGHILQVLAQQLVLFDKFVAGFFCNQDRLKLVISIFNFIRKGPTSGNLCTMIITRQSQEKIRWKGNSMVPGISRVFLLMKREATKLRWVQHSSPHF